jgi:hypothetical protein
VTENRISMEHTFFILISDEIFRMRQRIAQADPGTRGLQALKNSLQRMEDGLALQGYTVRDLAGQHYDDGMVCEVRDFIQDPDLAPGAKKVVRTFRPQVLYKNGIVSHGEIEVAVSQADGAHK